MKNQTGIRTTRKVLCQNPHLALMVACLESKSKSIPLNNFHCKLPPHEAFCTFLMPAYWKALTLCPVCFKCNAIGLHR